MSSFREIVTTLAFNSDLSARDMVQVANLLADPEPVDLRTHEQIVAFARTVPAVGLFLRNNQKINAIKALREAARGPQFIRSDATRDVLGLKECKDAIDVLA